MNKWTFAKITDNLKVTFFFYKLQGLYEKVSNTLNEGWRWRLDADQVLL